MMLPLYLAAGLLALYVLTWLVGGKRRATSRAIPTKQELQDTIIHVTPLPEIDHPAPAPAPAPEPEPMANFEIAHRVIAVNEGGFQKFSDDPGNYNSRGQLVGTNWGINAKVYEAHIGRPPNEADMRAMSKSTAKSIYKRLYWDKIRGDQIRDQQLATIFLDGHVNHGGWGIRMMQQVLGVHDDGVVGPVTLGALNAANPAELFERYRQRRIKFYNWYATVKRPEMEARWLRPWLNRMAAFEYRAGSSAPSSIPPTADGDGSGLLAMAAGAALFFLG